MSLVAEIPADVNWNPLPAAVNDYFLRPAPPPIDADDWPMWRAAQVLLPISRQKRAFGCRRHALHLAKDTHTGTVESVNPIACGDRVACPRCATVYAHERWWDHWSKLGNVAMTARVPIHVIEFRAAIPEWNAALKIAGCDRSETHGRMCPSTAGCRPCDAARPAHEGAAQVERDLIGWITRTWQERSPHSGGVRHTRLEQPDLFGPIELVITLHVPAIAVQTPNLKVCVNPRGALGAIRMFQLPPVAALESDWRAFVQTCYQGTGSLKHVAVDDYEAIQSAFEWTHRATFEILAQQLQAAGPGAPILPDAVRTLVRAAGLGVTGDSGKVRKFQRSAWFGCFVGTAQISTLNALQIEIRETAVAATVRVIDSYRILEVADTGVTVQSTRTAEIKLLPRAMVKLALTVDSAGRPTTPTRESNWIFNQTQSNKEHGVAFRIKLGLDAGGARIALQKGQSGLTRVKHSYTYRMLPHVIWADGSIGVDGGEAYREALKHAKPDPKGRAHYPVILPDGYVKPGTSKGGAK